MLRFTMFYVLLFVFSGLLAQKEDYIWLMGHEAYDIILPERAADTSRGAFNIDFNNEPPYIYYNPDRLLDFSGVNSGICDSEGKILAYTNGQVIYNQFDKPIADTINYGPDWEYSNVGDKDMAIPEGLLGIQGALILPKPDEPSVYYTFYTTLDREHLPYVHYQISYALIEVGDIDPNGSLLAKDVVMLKDSFSMSLTAVRHGNGRDWWLIAPRKVGNVLNIWLIDPEGIHFYGRQETNLPSFRGIGQIYSSPDGEWLSWFVGGKLIKKGGQLFLAKFDRCAGTISDPHFVYVDLSDYRLGNGISFSYDSRYLYMCNRDFLYQYDMEEEDVLGSESKVATYDGYKYYFPFDTIQPLGYSVNFSLLGLAPDGRIYISPSSAWTRMISVIHFPQKRGEDCDVRQHSILTPTGFSRGLPNYPMYRLGALDGSSCDTLGIDNNPVSKFRFEVDSSDYLSLYFTDLSYYRPESWIWDFGDGSAKVTERYPTHVFSQKGTYRVCLTVSNENSSDENCQSITIGTTNTDNVEVNTIVDFNLFPNPTHDFLQITIGRYIPEHGSVCIYDMSGKLALKQRVYYGQNTLNLTSLVKGTYSCVLKDGKIQIGVRKVTKY